MMKSKSVAKSPGRRTNLAISRPLSRIGRAPLVSASTLSASPNGNVKVVVRLRPLSFKEQGDNHRVIVKKIDNQLLIFDPKEESQAFFYQGVQQRQRDLMKRSNKDIQFLFDRVFNDESNNEDIFTETTCSLIDSLMDGFNCSVFAYGATGAGKTFTMLGNCENPGITILTMKELFRKKEELASEREFTLAITYLEVYNEMVQDLLNPGPQLTLREDNKFGVVVAGIKYESIDNAEKLFSLLEKGNKNRTQHPTDSNAESSRSHAVLQVYIQMKFRTTGEVRIAKLSMIDLAGSERGSATGFQGARFTEGANINKSLLALGNCINSLADGHRHVPYRDSKLTRILKDSLGGNCQTVMIANISASSFSYEDTYNTLRYATRAKAIKSSMKRNVVNTEKGLDQYVTIVAELNKKVEQLQAELRDSKNRKTEVQTVSLPEPDPTILQEVEDIFQQREVLLEHIFNYESREQIVALRSSIKSEINSRLSEICTESLEKEEGHRKLENVIERSQKQGDTFKTELSSLRTQKDELKNRAIRILQNDPQLKPIIELNEAKLNKMEVEFKNQLIEKKSNIFECEMNHRGEIVSSMASILKPCFLQLKGHGYASKSLIENYQDLIRKMQGMKYVTFDDQITDSGVCSTTSASTITEDEDDLIRDVENNVNSTFVLPSEAQKKPTRTVLNSIKPPPKTTNFCAANRLAISGHKSPRAARVSPRIKNISRPPLRTLSGHRTPTKKNNSSAIVPFKPSAISIRPTFRR